MFENGPRGCDQQPGEEGLGSVNLRSPWDPTWDSVWLGEVQHLGFSDSKLSMACLTPRGGESDRTKGKTSTPSVQLGCWRQHVPWRAQRQVHKGLFFFFWLWVITYILEEGMATYSSILAWRIPMHRGAWRATVHGVAEPDMTE